MENKRPNRHTNPTKYGKRKNNGRFKLFLRKRNREVKQLLREMA